ncbi:flagellar protein FlgN [Ruminiclostridium cellobioparum]|uniref:FlgN protein n=1 Tax=Ruminiclostridium cellobioparum subsp. termitidis CT1112 TaxID=1195236 RepID=S0FGB5_RUMCE|nr:flagellar protein FlgN [Ruminiclostridium cellobioparum]EMS70390.1 FlgN protein [Ruminiclostridium cellobioparum subsp. termitidis CT1112]
MNADQYIQKLLELSDKKLNGLRKILKLTEEQSNVITEDNTEELQRIIELKQQQMDMIDELDQAFEVYYSRLKSLMGVQSLEELKMSELNGASELKQIVTSVYDIIKQIQKLEDLNNKKARDILDKLSSEIRQIKQAQKVNNGYNMGGNLPQQSYYFDKKK